MSLLIKLAKENWIHGLAIVLFLAIPSVFFYPEFQGNTMSRDDINEGAGQYGEFSYLSEYSEANGLERKTPLWTSGIYIGQPSYFWIGVPSQLASLHSILQLGFDQYVGYFFLLSLGIYLCMLVMGVPPPLAIIGGIALALSTNNIVLYQAGHMMKIGSIMYAGFILAGTYLITIKQRYLVGIALYALGFSLSIYMHHIQMIYYIYMCLVLFGLIYAVHYIREKEFSRLSKVFFAVLAGSLLGIGPNVAKLWTTYELSQESIRGPNIIEAQVAPSVDSNTPSNEAPETDGLDWDYAMQWSNNSLDVLSAIIPRIVGGSSAERVQSGASYNALRRAGSGINADGSMLLPLYWGDLPFTSGPTYFGAIIVFLAILGGFLVRGKLKWWLVSSTVLTIAMSYGDNFGLLNRLLFDHLPLFNKFRTPMSVLSVTIIFVTLLSILGLHQYILSLSSKKDRNTALRSVFIAACITAGGCLLIAILGPNLFSFSGANDATYRNSGLLPFLIEDRKSFLTQDAIRSAVLIIAATITLYAMSLKKMKVSYALIILGGLILVDFWGVNRRYIHPSDYEYETGAELEQEYYVERDVDREIYAREESRFDYRVLDLSINTFNTNYTTYFHNTIGGYTPTKLQRIQDIIDYHLSGPFTPGVLNMLNTKYIIDQNEELLVNADALGFAWFVNQIEYVTSNRDEIEKLYEIDPSTTAIIKQDEFQELLPVVNLSESTPTDRIVRTEYLMDNWAYEYDVDSPRLAVFSEMWYKPKLGLKAFINDEEADFIRVNYMLRGIIVPEGSGVIEFRFEPPAYKTGVTISNASFYLLLTLLLIPAILSVYGVTRKN